MLPEQVTSIFMRFYRTLLRPADRPLFLRTLVADFGIQPADIDAAASAWARARSSMLAGSNGCERPSAATTAETTGTDGDGGREAALLRAADRLRGACRPLYVHLLNPISHQPNGECARCV